MTVKSWPAYLLRGIPTDLRARLSARAEADQLSLADVIRQALCLRYKMECEVVSYRYQPELDTGNDVIIIRVQPEVWRKVKKEAGPKYGALKALILGTLTDYLREDEPQ